MAEDDGSNGNIIGYTAEETQDEFRVHIEISDPESALVDIDEDGIKVLVPNEDEAVDEGDMLLGEIPLPEGADVDNMEASVEDGHLDLIIPKRQAEA